MKPLFGVSKFTTWHQTFEEDVSLYMQLGVDAIEVCERKLSKDKVKAQEQLSYLKETNLPVCSIQLKEVNHPNFGLLLDVWHVWREPMILERLASLGNIFAVHLCDWPKGEPRAIADRVIVGEGLIDVYQFSG